MINMSNNNVAFANTCSPFHSLDLGLSDSDGEDADDEDDGGGDDFFAAFNTPSAAVAAPLKSSLKKRKIPLSIRAKSVFKVPIIKFMWFDSKGHQHMTIIAHMPAGSFKKGCITGAIKNNRKVVLTLDYTHLVILDPEKYNKAFKDENGNAMYYDGHVRTVEHAKVVRQMKGKSSLTRLKAKFTINLDTEVENAFSDSEGFEGFQVFRVGPAGNPQIFCHMELMCKRSGHNNAQPKGGYENFCSSGSESE